MAELTVARTLAAIAPSPVLELLPPASRHILRGAPQALAAAAAALGLGDPARACRAEIAGERTCLWLGPDERLLVAPVHETEAVAELIARAVSLPHALVDVSHRQIALQVRGASAATVLASGCPLDLHPEAFPPGMCTRTVLNKAEVVLWRTAEHTFRIEVSRSFARYVSRLLADAAKESAT